MWTEAKNHRVTSCRSMTPRLFTERPGAKSGLMPSPITARRGLPCFSARRFCAALSRSNAKTDNRRSEEHTSELQSQSNLVCRLLLEKKKKKKKKKIR